MADVVPAIIFDLDGTLLDTEALSDRAMLAVYDSWLSEQIKQERKADGLRIPWELKKKILGLRGAEWAPIVIDYAYQHWNVPRDKITASELWAQWESRLNELCPEVEACAGALNLVTIIDKSNIAMAIATSSRSEAVKKKSSRHGAMFSKIKLVVPGDHEAVKNGKPAPDIYLEAARQLQIDKENMRKCLVFEDALSGVRAGKAAGCMVVAVPDPRFTAEERQVFKDEADVVLNDLTEFSWELVRDKFERLRRD